MTPRTRPILFSSEMVRAILEGRKTQTRRVVTVPWAKGKRALPYYPYCEEFDGKLFYLDQYGDSHPMEERCPYGQPGDTLWVREAWRTEQTLDKMSASKMVDACLDAGYRKPWAPIRFEADGRFRDWDMEERHAVGRLRPSIHMPRWASRITLEVTGVRVERVQDISEADAEAEGIQVSHYYCDEPTAELEGLHRCDPVGKFRQLWDSINGAREGCSWADDPWCWCVAFRVVRA